MSSTGVQLYILVLLFTIYNDYIFIKGRFIAEIFAYQ